MHGQFFCFCVLLGKLVTFLVLLPCSIWFLCVHNRQWLPVVTGYSFAILGVRVCKFPQFTHDLRLLKFHLLLRVFCSCKRLKAYSGIGRRVIAAEQKKFSISVFFFFFGLLNPSIIMFELPLTWIPPHHYSWKPGSRWRSSRIRSWQKPNTFPG